MKTLIDGNEVPARIYYYLLDFNESDKWETLRLSFGVNQLYQLNIYQFTELFKYASAKDFNKLYVNETNV